MKRAMDHEDEEKLNIRVRTQVGMTRAYSIDKYTSIMKLLQSHCHRKDTHYRTVTFLIDGERFDHKKTPAELQLRDGSLIEALVQVHGGGSIGSSSN